MAKNDKLAVKAKAGALAPLEDWEIELQAKAKEARAKETLGVARIVHNNKGISIDGAQVKDNKLPHVIIDYCFTKTFFKSGFSPGKSDTPVCYAYATKQDGEPKTPHPSSPEPQAASCATCGHNAFGTALQGTGKRCSDGRKVMALVGIPEPTEVQKAEVRQYSVPPGSLKNWGNFLDAIPEVHPTGAPQSVAVELGWVPGEVAYKLTWRIIDRLDKETFKSAVAKAPALEGQMFAPWPKLGDKEAPVETEEQKAKKEKRSKKIK